MNEKIKNKLLELHQTYGDIQIKCKGSDSLPIDSIKDLQKDLKKLSQDNLIKLASSIFINGFCAPFFIWDNKGDYFALDGNQRVKVLCAIREAGIPIPGLFPIAIIEAEDEKDAKQKLLAITSQYGEFQIDQLDQWISDISKEIKDTLRLNLGEIKLEVDTNRLSSPAEGKEEQSVRQCPACGYQW